VGGMNDLRREILELFAEASRLGRHRRAPLGLGLRVHREPPLTRKPPRPMRVAVDHKLLRAAEIAVKRHVGWRDNGWGYEPVLMREVLAIITATGIEREACGACGGVLERRPGNPRPTHLGSCGLRLQR
jgi:hypothetical protein